MNAYLSDKLNLACSLAVERKLFVCEREKGVAGMPPTLMADFRDKITIAEYDGVDDPIAFIPSVLESLFAHGVRQFDTIGFMAEILGREVPVDDYISTEGSAGGLDEEFLTNPFTDIKMGLTVHIVIPTKETASRFIPYIHDDQGMPVFDTSDKNFIFPESRAIPHLISFVDYCKEHGDLTTD